MLCYKLFQTLQVGANSILNGFGSQIIYLPINRGSIEIHLIEKEYLKPEVSKIQIKLKRGMYA